MFGSLDPNYVFLKINSSPFLSFRLFSSQLLNFLSLSLFEVSSFLPFNSFLKHFNSHQKLFLFHIPIHVELFYLNIIKKIKMILDIVRKQQEVGTEALNSFQILMELYYSAKLLDLGTDK